MVTLVRIPKPSANVEQVTIMRWLVQEGQSVRKDDPIAEASTEKNALDITAPANGVLRSVISPAKSVLPTNYIIAIIAAPDDVLPDVSTENEQLMRQVLQAATISPSSTAPAPVTAGPPHRRQRVRATPAARRLSKELSIDLSDVAAATGDDVVSEAHVREYAQSKDHEATVSRMEPQ